MSEIIWPSKKKRRELFRNGVNYYSSEVSLSCAVIYSLFFLLSELRPGRILIWQQKLGDLISGKGELSEQLLGLLQTGIGFSAAYLAGLILILLLANLVQSMFILSFSNLGIQTERLSLQKNPARRTLVHVLVYSSFRLATLSVISIFLAFRLSGYLQDYTDKDQSFWLDSFKTDLYTLAALVSVLTILRFLCSWLQFNYEHRMSQTELMAEISEDAGGKVTSV